MVAVALPRNDPPAVPSIDSAYRSPLLGFPGAVAADGPDSGIAWHYGDPIGEQRAAERGAAVFDLSHRGVIAVSGPERLTWLNTLTSQLLTDLPAGAVHIFKDDLRQGLFSEKLLTGCYAARDRRKVTLADDLRSAGLDV